MTYIVYVKYHDGHIRRHEEEDGVDYYRLQRALEKCEIKSFSVRLK